MLLLVILPRLILLIELVFHVMCQSFQFVCSPPLEGLLLSIWWNPKSLALISPIDKIGRKAHSLYNDHVGQSDTCRINWL